jgi:hypothetical protein
MASPSLDWLRALVEPRRVLDWSLADWDRVVRLARRHRLLARLACRIDAAGLGQAVPAPVRSHLRAARTLSEYRMRALRWAAERLPEMLDHPSHPLVLLKGAAYIAQGLPIADGRLPSDLDILIPKRHLVEVRFRLAAAGWREPALNEHDRRYYLEWSHELPPMTHPRHGVELDVHHNILPPRDGRMPDADRLFERLLPSRLPPWQVLCPVDQFLHSAAHLFFDSEPRDRVRDLVDLDGLVREFAGRATFWDELSARALELRLAEPLVLACRFTSSWLGTPVPEPLRSSPPGASAASPAWVRAAMAAVLTPTEPDRQDALGKRLASAALLARYHWHRMPLRRLVPHLWRKWRIGRAEGDAQDAPTAPDAI